MPTTFTWMLCLALAWTSLSGAHGAITIGPHGTMVNGVGYPTHLPVEQAAKLTLDTPVNTQTAIPQQYLGIREAKLSCDPVGPVNRVVNCEIRTFDLCGNLYGQEYNVSSWLRAVQHTTKGVYSKHVSKVVYVSKGLAKFYFTPWESGFYKVFVWRRVPNKFGSLRTENLMSMNVVAHDVTVRCSPALSTIQPTLRHVMWSQAASTTLSHDIAGIPANKWQTDIFGEAAAGAVFADQQEKTARVPLQPVVHTDLLEFLNANVPQGYVCDYIRRLV